MGSFLEFGEIDAAFEYFDRAVEERDQMMMPVLSYAHLWSNSQGSTVRGLVAEDEAGRMCIPVSSLFDSEQLRIG